MDDIGTAAEAETSGGVDKSATAKLVAAVALAVAFTVFAVQNTDSIDVDFLAWSFSTPTIVLMVACVVIGMVIQGLAGFLWRRKRR